MKLPRDVSAKELVKKIEKLGYTSSRQTGSHIRLTKITKDGQSHITVPNHNPIKIGTLNKILNDIANHCGYSKEELINELFI